MALTVAAWGTVGFGGAQEAVNLPFTSDFTDASAWTLLNQADKNRWVIGEDANTKYDGDGRCLYISADGDRFAYDSPAILSASSVAHAYFKVNIPEGQQLLLSFRYFVSGDSDERNDGYVEAGLYVGVLDGVPSEGEKVPVDNYQGTYADKTSWYVSPALWNEAVLTIDGTQTFGERYIVFTWYNDENATRYGTFAAVADVVLKVDDCPAPANLTVGTVTANSIAYTWTPAAGIGEGDLAGYTYQAERKTGTGAWETVSPAPAASASSLTLTGLSENTAYGFRIRGYRSEASYSLWVTAPTTTTAYACPAPTDFSMSENTAGDYVFTWKGDASKYRFEYRKSAADDWTPVDVTTATYTLASDGLAAAAAYEARVRALCADGDLPVYADTIKFTTPCGVMTLPYAEDFETWQSDNSLSCWMLLDKDGVARTWNVKYSFASYDDRTGASVKFNYNTKTGDRLILPALTIPAVSELRFWVKTGGYSTNPVPYAVLISTTDTKPESFVTLPTPTLMEKTPWTEQRVLIDEAYVGKTVYLAIEAQSTIDLYIDDLTVKPYPAPAVAVSVTTTTAVLALSPAALSYAVRYRTVGTETWTTLENQTATVSLELLTAGTAYEVQAMAHYAGGHASEWSDVLAFGTCVSLPYVQDFSDVETGMLPVGWSQDDKSNFEWRVAEKDGLKVLKFPIQVGSGYVYSGYSNALLPIFSMVGVDKDRLELVFTYSQKAYSSLLNVRMSTDGGKTWETLSGNGKPLGTLAYASNAANVVSETKTLPLGELVGDAASLMLRFDANYSSSSEVNLYDVRVQEHPRCLPPSDLRIVTEAQTPTTAEVAWTAPAEMTPTGYTLRYATSEAGLETAEARDLTADELSATLEALQPNHTLYHVRMTSVCEENGESIESDPAALTFHTLYTCPKMTDLHLTKLTDTRAELAFSYAMADVNCEVEYKTAAAADWTPLQGTGTDKTFGIPGLSASTRYMVRVRVVCEADDRSLWDTVEFQTPCALQTLPLREGFEEPFTAWAPACWQYGRLSGPASILQWERADYYAMTGRYALRHPGNTGGTALMVSPYLDLRADEYYRLTFCYRPEGYESGKTDGLGLWFNTAPAVTGGRELAFLPNHEDDAAYAYEEAVGTIGEKWRRFTFDSLTGLEAGYLLLYAQGDANQGQAFYIDDISLTRIYAKNLALQVVPMPARADMGQEPVSVVLENTGEVDFTGEVRLSYQVNASAPVSETVTFTAEQPLQARRPYIYTFAAKADLTAKGTYTVKAMLEAAGDPDLADNAAECATASYAPLAVPFETDFQPGSTGAEYLHTVNADWDDYEWILPPEQPQAMIYGRNSGALDDYLYTPGLALAAGEYEVTLTYAARQANYMENLSVHAYTGFTRLEEARPIMTDSTADVTPKTVQGRLAISEAGIFMVGLHAESDSSRGINVYALSVKAVSAVRPLVAVALSDTICTGESYRFGGRELIEAGRYTDTVRATAADTVRTLTLTVLAKPEPPVIRREDADNAVELVAETPEVSVQWYEGGEMIFGAEEKRFAVMYDGVYHATAVGVCGESEASNVLTVQLTANEDLTEAVAPLFYPNPARTQVTVKAVAGALRGLRLVAKDGRVVVERKGLDTPETTLSVRDCPQGLYLLYVETDRGGFVRKLQVVR